MRASAGGRGRLIGAVLGLGVLAAGLPVLPFVGSVAPAGASSPVELPVSVSEPMPWDVPGPVYEPLPADEPVPPPVSPPSVASPLDGVDKVVHLPGEEIVELRTATSKVFATDVPSSYKAHLYSGPVHFLDGTGAWRDIDTTLQTAGGVARPAATGFGLELPLNAAAGLVRFELDEDTSVAYSLAGAVPTTGVIDGPVVSHTGVLPDVGVELTALAQGVKEELVLASPEAPTEYVFPLVLDGLTAAIDAQGDVILSDGSGTPRVRMPAGFMVDSNTTVDGVEGVQSSGGVTYELVSVRAGGASAADAARRDVVARARAGVPGAGGPHAGADRLSG